MLNIHLQRFAEDVAGGSVLSEEDRVTLRNLSELLLHHRSREARRSLELNLEVTSEIRRAPLDLTRPV